MTRRIQKPSKERQRKGGREAYYSEIKVVAISLLEMVQVGSIIEDSGKKGIKIG